MAFRLSHAAEEDILDIVEKGIRQFGLARARRYHDDLFALFDLIARNPRLARERFELSPPVRLHPFKSHLVIYRADHDGNVLIIRIRHGHEDWAADAC